MKNDDEILQSLIAGGLIGGTLGAILSKNQEDGATLLGAVIGAAILGTFKANQKARETHIPLVMEEGGKLYQINANGNKQFLRDIEKPKIKIQENFKLK